MDNSNQLLHFLTAATSNLQEALSKPCNGKKVNHRRYIQKRLQKRSDITSNKTTTKKATILNKTPSATPVQLPVSTNIRPHPVATAMSPSLYWSSNNTTYYTPSVHPSAAITPPLSSSSSSSSINSGGHYTRPQSCPTTQQHSYDVDFESLLSEIGLETSPSSQYSEVSTNTNTLSRQPSLNTVHWDTYLPPNEFIPSPHSDFSDVDDSAYSSPRNPSPVYYPIQVCSPPNTTVTTTTSCYHVAGTGSCEWLPPTSTILPTIPPYVVTPTSLTVPSSLNEILELVTP